jgi:hypothetical protein
MKDFKIYCPPECEAMWFVGRRQNNGTTRYLKCYDRKISLSKNTA